MLNPAPSAAGDDITVYVQIRPRHSVTAKALRQLAELSDKHPSATVTIAGMSRSERYNHITLAVSVGPVDEIKTRSNASVAALEFVDTVMQDLSDYLPCYVERPTEDEYDNAVRVLAAAAETPATERTVKGGNVRQFPASAPRGHTGMAFATSA